MSHLYYTDSAKRSAIKTVTYRIVVVIVDLIVVYWLTHTAEMAIGFTVVSNIYTSIAYYLHERLWSKINLADYKNRLNKTKSPRWASIAYTQ